MTNFKLLFFGIAILLLQIVLSEFLSINGIRPDFILIYLVYVSVRLGSFSGLIFGFIIGLLSDSFGVGSTFGLSSLTYTITGYFIGIFCSQNKKITSFQFYLISVTIIGFHFFFNNFYTLPINLYR